MLPMWIVAHESSSRIFLPNNRLESGQPATMALLYQTHFHFATIHPKDQGKSRLIVMYWILSCRVKILMKACLRKMIEWDSPNMVDVQTLPSLANLRITLVWHFHSSAIDRCFYRRMTALSQTRELIQQLGVSCSALMSLCSSPREILPGWDLLHYPIVVCGMDVSRAQTVDDALPSREAPGRLMSTIAEVVVPLMYDMMWWAVLESLRAICGLLILYVTQKEDQRSLNVTKILDFGDACTYVRIPQQYCR